MRPSIIILSVSLLLCVSATVSAGESCPVVEPGKSLGPITLGMSLGELEKTGLAISDGPIETWLLVGNYDVRMEGGAVAAIGADSSRHGCVRLAGQDLELPGTSLEALATMAAASCGPLQFNIGATVIECGAGLLLLQHIGGKEIRVTAAGPDPELLCDHWIAPGGGSDTEEARLEEGSRVCFQGMVFTRDLVPDDVVKLSGKMHISTCEQIDTDGATVVNCHYSGVRLVFTGADSRLSRVESIALKE